MIGGSGMCNIEKLIETVFMGAGVKSGNYHKRYFFILFFIFSILPFGHCINEDHEIRNVHLQFPRELYQSFFNTYSLGKFLFVLIYPLHTMALRLL